MSRPVPAAVSSPIPAVLLKLGPLGAARVADLRPYGSVPDPRSRRGRWYSLTAILLVCACAVVSGARSIDGRRSSTAWACPSWPRTSAHRALSSNRARSSPTSSIPTTDW
ncbi:transposase family protein [Streptomyces sp. NPDC004135]